MNWRDVAHPEGGGSERYVESVARRLGEHGWDVTLLCAAHDGTGAGPTGTGSGCCTSVAGSPSTCTACCTCSGTGTTSWSTSRTASRSGAGWSPAARSSSSCTTSTARCGRWPSGRWPRGSAGGWSPGSRRGSTAAAATSRSRSRPARDLVALGIAADRIDLVHNGTEAWGFATRRPSAGPRLSVVGRLVPHKQVEHAVDVVAALAPRHDVHLDVVGHGYWEDADPRARGRPRRRRPGAPARLRHRRPQARADVRVLGPPVPVAEGGLGTGLHRGGAPWGADRRLPRPRVASPSPSGTAHTGLLVDDVRRPGAGGRRRCSGRRPAQPARASRRGPSPTATRGMRRRCGSRASWTPRQAGWFSARRRRRAACRPGRASSSAEVTRPKAVPISQDAGHDSGHHDTYERAHRLSSSGSDRGRA